MTNRLGLSATALSYVNDPLRLAGVRKHRKDQADRLRLARRLGWFKLGGPLAKDKRHD